MRRFSPRTLVLLFSVGVVTFILGLILTAFSGDLFEKPSAHCDTFSRSLVGHHGFKEFLKRSGITPVVSCSRSMDLIKGPHPLLILEPLQVTDPFMFTREKEKKVSSKHLKELLKAANAESMPVVLSLPKRSVSASFDNPKWIVQESLLRINNIEQLLEDAFPNLRKISGIPWISPLKVARHNSLSHFKGKRLGVASPDIILKLNPQTLKPGEHLTPLLECDEGVLIGKLTDNLYLISDPDLFNNRGLSKGDHALVMRNLIHEILAAEVVVIDETLHGHTNSQSLMKRIMTFPLVLIVIHALLFLGLLIWAVSRRLGNEIPPPPPLPPGKELLIDNTSKLLLFGKDYKYAAKQYFKMTLTQAAKRYHLNDGELLSGLETLTKARGLDADLDKINRTVNKKSLTPYEALKSAKDIYAWREALFNAQKMET